MKKCQIHYKKLSHEKNRYHQCTYIAFVVYSTFKNTKILWKFISHLTVMVNGQEYCGNDVENACQNNMNKQRKAKLLLGPVYMNPARRGLI